MLKLPLYPENRLIVSIYDWSGAWPRPYIKAGYPTILWDYKHEGCLLTQINRLQEDIYEAEENGYTPWGLMAAPPCTDISKAGAQYWPIKDKSPAPDGPWGPDMSVTEYAAALVEVVLIFRDLFPWKWWVMENPPGRLEKLVPHAAKYRAMSFNPCDYGDPYKKDTILWGEFNTGLPRKPVEPITVTQTSRGKSWQASAMMAKAGGKSERTKTIRSNTPKGFAKAFFTANP
jgi:hypothetical protein